MAYTLTGSIGLDHYRATLQTKQHTWHADEPSNNGGQDSAPTPGQLVLGALAACKVITTRMYADRKGWPVGKILVELEMIVDNGVRPTQTQINCRLHAEGDLDDSQQQRLVDIADKCPTHRLLTGDIAVESKWHDAPPL
ncbi:MAG: OsmC family protein [Saprospiraceae bacterium]|nr:OsmC family protein [Saprospiraceae bacterium]